MLEIYILFNFIVLDIFKASKVTTNHEDGYFYWLVGISLIYKKKMKIFIDHNHTFIHYLYFYKKKNYFVMHMHIFYANEYFYAIAGFLYYKVGFALICSQYKKGEAS